MLGLGLHLRALASAAALPPTLTALVYPQIGVANGVSQPITMPGTNLSGATLVTVGSATVAPISSTSTTVTFIPPANAAGGTLYSCKVTTPGGTSNILANAFGYISSCNTACWYAGQLGMTTIGTGVSALKDLIGGAVVAQATGSQQPTVTTLAAGAHPAVMNFNRAASQCLRNTTLVLPAQPLAHYMALRFVVGSGIQGFVDSTLSARCLSYYDTGKAALYAGANLDGSNSDFLSFIEAKFNGASSAVTVGAITTTGNGGTDAGGTGVVLGATDGGAGATNFLSGQIVFAAIANAPSAADDTAMHAFATAFTGVA